MYRYVKAPPGEIHKKPFFLQKNKYSWIVSSILMSLGVTVLLWTFWPVISFMVFTDPLLSKIISPIAAESGFSPVVLANTGKPSSDDASTNANTWFPAKPQEKVVTQVNAYTLSIPKLNIKDATVIIAGDDLKKSLIHYGGTGLPGRYGTTVIFGHSTLPQLYNPKNYETIFSTLPSLKPGDEIFVKYDGVDYRYIIYDMVITDPTDLSVLEQSFDDSYITLITCVPPGTTWKRLNVKARLMRLTT